MYQNESPEYLYTMDYKATKRRLLGTIGSVSFAGKDVIRGSFEVSNRCAEESNMIIGGVYIGQLNMTFAPSFLSKISRKNYIGKVIAPTIGLYVDDNQAWEDIPVGIYTVESANISRDGITIEAYDNMKKFDKPFSLYSLYGKPFDILSLICNECGVTLGVTQAYIESLPNGTEDLYLDDRNDIETFRDVLYWITQTVVCFATINRAGSLELRKFGLGTTEFDEEHRDIDAIYSDYVTKWTSISMYDYDEEETQYYSLVPDDGLCMNLGENPFLQTVSDISAQEAIAILEAEIIAANEQIDGIEDEIDALDDDIDDVEEQLREDPDNPELLAELARLIQEKESKEAEIKALEKQIADDEEELENVRKGIVKRSKVFKDRARKKMLKEIAKIQFTPFHVTSARDPIFDLGDKIIFTGGMAQGETCCIMSLDYKIDSFTFEGYGDNPALSDSRSATDKSVTGSKRSQKKDEKLKFAYYVNAGQINIHKNQETEIGHLRFGLGEDVDVETWVELKLKTDLSSVEALKQAGIAVKYYLDGQEVAYQPVEEWQVKTGTSGLYLLNNVLHFSSQTASETEQVHTVNFNYHTPQLASAMSHIWRVAVVGLEGDMIIDTGDAHIVVWAQSLKGDSEWIGRIEARDEIPFYLFGTLDLFSELTEDVIIRGLAPVEIDDLITEDGDDLTTEDDDDLTTE